MGIPLPGQNKIQRGLELKHFHLVRNILEIVALLVVVLLMGFASIQTFYVFGISMEPGLVENEKIVVNKVFYWFRSPARGDVIVLHNPQKPNEDLAKRIIGLPGDTIKMDSSHVWVNDVLLNEPYLKAPSNAPQNLVANTWHVPPDQYFVLGDNRVSSLEDSRFIGFIPRDYIVGKVGLVCWPLNKIHFIDNYSSVFAKIKSFIDRHVAIEEIKGTFPMPNSGRRNRSQVSSEDYLEEEYMLPPNGLRNSMIIGGIGGIIALAVPVIIALANASLSNAGASAASKGGEGISYQVAMALFGLQCFGAIVDLAIAFGVGMVAGRFVVNWWQSVVAGAVDWCNCPTWSISLLIIFLATQASLQRQVLPAQLPRTWLLGILYPTSILCSSWRSDELSRCIYNTI